MSHASSRSSRPSAIADSAARREAQRTSSFECPSPSGGTSTFSKYWWRLRKLASRYNHEQPLVYERENREGTRTGRRSPWPGRWSPTWAAFFIPNAVMQNYPDQVTEAMRNDADCFVMSQTTVHDLEDAPLAFDSSIRSLIENAAHLAVTLWRVPAAVRPRSLPFPRMPLPTRRAFRLREGRCLGTQFGDNLSRRIHSEPGDYRQPLDCILVPLEQPRYLPLQLTDLLLDELQALDRQLYQSAIDRVELCAGTACHAAVWAWRKPWIMTRT
jgi:hypothetical protein